MAVSLASGVLISNTLLCEASRILKRPERSPRSHRFTEKQNAYRLLDLFSLIEATALYERLYTLPARLNVTGETLALREVLVGNKIAVELDLPDDHLSIARLIMDALAGIDNPIIEPNIPVDFETDVSPKIAAYFASDTDQIIEHHRTTVKHLGIEFESIDSAERMPANIFDINDFSEAGWLGQESDEEGFEPFGRKLIALVLSQDSGAYEHCTSFLRDLYYIYLAEYKNIPYWPQTTRVEFARNYPNYMERGVRTKLYEKLATELRTTVGRVEEVFGKKIMYIPPFSALVLDRSRNVNDIPRQTLRIRNEFMWLRYDMEQLEREMQEADSFGKMQKVVRKQEELSEAIAERFGNRNHINLERGIKMIPKLVKPALKPTEPTSYVEALLSQPIEWFINLIRHRPIAFLFDLESKVERISEYEKLVSKVFKGHVKDYGTAEQFLKSSS